MTLSGSGFNLPVSQFSPSPIPEDQIAQKNVGDVGRNNVVIVPGDKMEEIPLSKLAERNTWNYKTTADRPTLKNMGQLRGLSADLKASDEGWKTLYNDLLQSLPKEILASLLEKQPEALQLAAVIQEVAQALSALNLVEAQLQTEAAIQKAAIRQQFPLFCVSNGWVQGKELLNTAQKWLEEIGPNDPHYVEIQDQLSGLEIALTSLVQP